MPTEQRNLFDTEPEPWEADDQSEQLVAGVVLASGPPQEFDYLVPEPLSDQVEPGRRVQVPLGKGNRLVVGYCVRVETRVAGTRTLKSVSDVIDGRSLLSPAMLRLTRWIGEYYLCPWGQVLETVLAGRRARAGGHADGHAAEPRSQRRDAAGCERPAGKASRTTPYAGRGEGTAHAAGIGPRRQLLDWRQFPRSAAKV